jgi:hypothetical protein
MVAVNRRDTLKALAMAACATSAPRTGQARTDSAATLAKMSAIIVADIDAFFHFARTGGLSTLLPDQEIVSTAEGVRWQVLDPAATIFDLDFDGQKLAVLPVVGTLQLEAFGVNGSATADDHAAWLSATRAALRNGTRLLGRKGSTYRFDPFSNGTLTVVPMNGQSFWLDLQGATLQFADNLAPPKNTRFFAHQLLIAMRRETGASRQAAKLVRIENVVTDGNLRNQHDPRIGTVAAEQMAHVKIICRATDGNSLERVEVRNLRSVDPVADCVFVGPSEARALPDKQAAVSHVHLENMHAGRRKSVRAFIALGSAVNRATIRNVTCDPRGDGDGNSIETEFSAIGSQHVSLDLANCDVDDLEFGGVRNREAQLQVSLRHCTARRFALFVFCNVDARDCSFGVSLRNAWQFRQATLENIIFRHATYQSGGRVEVHSLYFHSTANGPHHILLRNCRHEIQGEPARDHRNPLIRFGTDPMDNLGSKQADIEAAWFDPRAAVSVHNRSGWALRTTGCTFAGSRTGVSTGGFRSGSTTYAGRWHSRNDDFAAVSGLPFEIQDVPGMPTACHLAGGIWPTLDFGFIGDTCSGVARATGRMLTARGLPRFAGGLPGDQIWLAPDVRQGARPGSPVRWMCLRCGPGGRLRKAAKYRVIARA